MKCIVNPQYRWLNRLLICAYALVALSQIVQAILDQNSVIHLLLGALFIVLALLIARITPWAYVAAGSMNLLSVLGLLMQAASLSTVRFLILLLAAATAWCAFFLRGQLLEPIGNESP
jgi:hypothetical protein